MTTEIVVTDQPSSEVTGSQEADVSTAADAVVLAAETAIALVEGQAALAEQQSAAIIVEAAENAEAAADDAAEIKESFAWLISRVEELQLQVLTMETRLSTLELSATATPPEMLAVETVDGETGTTSTLISTSPETNETLTEAIDVSEAVTEPAEEQPLADPAAKRVRIVI